MRKIAVFTGTRAEYGLLYWLLKDIHNDINLTLQLIVSGAHLSPEFGNTWQQIEKDGFVIDAKVEMLLSSDTATGIVKSMGIGMIGFADALSRLQPDVLVVLGDRYEALAIVQAAMIFKIPVVHLHGGEITEGAVDDAIRHAITKLSQYHCTSTEAYRRRVIQLGEAPERVKNVGAIGLDHLKRSRFLSLAELGEALEFKLQQPYFVVTYHPVTLANEAPVETFQALLQSLDDYPDYQVIITYPNADAGGRSIIPLLEAYAAKNRGRVLAIPSLGQLRYLSAVQHAAAVIGNSSSGIIEVPAFNKPTIDIGERQKGRLAANSVIHCEADYASITHAIAQACKTPCAQHIDNPYGQGNASAQVIELLKTLELDCVKHFYDVALPGEL